jgi:uncharacterized membrane protein YgcG
MALRFSLGTLLAFLAMIAVPPQHLANADDLPSADDTAINIPRPGEHELVKDLAHLLTDSDEQQIKQITARLVTDKSIPIVVVTIESMKDHSPFKLRIETFANLLFDQWQIGPAEVDGQEWNRGILLLVSKGDRKARIELGAGWRRDQDRQSQRIMQDQIVPHFKRNDYSGGILAGVKALDALAREQSGARPAAAAGGLPPATPRTIVPPQNAPHAVAPHANRPLPQFQQQFPHQLPRAWPQPMVQPPRASNGLAIAVLVVIGAVAVIVISKFVSVASGVSGTRRRGLGARHVTSDSWWGGPFGWQNWGLYEMSRQNWQQQNNMSSHTTSHFSDGGMSHGGGFSSGGSIDTSSSAPSSFDGGSSGGGGATGSW